VPDRLAELRYELALANRILAHEGLLDAFGHVSVRHPGDPGRYLLSRSRSPELVEPDDFLEFTLDSKPVTPTTAHLYSERAIHSEIYKARPDVMSVAHHHAPAILPYCISGEELVPVFHLGSTIGTKVPMWDQRDEFGDTNLLVRTPEEGASLARALGAHSMVLMWRHGATVVGRDIRECAFRSVYACRNAEHQSAAKRNGGIAARGMLSPGEIEIAGTIFAQPNVVSRVWEYWVGRLTTKGGLPAPAARAASKKRGAAGKKAASSKRSAAKTTADKAKGRRARGRTR
jgi:HCOMODA/2-hydroxy-3-carboxy-muconic semialdehyde decarboxylase